MCSGFRALDRDASFARAGAMSGQTGYNQLGDALAKACAAALSGRRTRRQVDFFPPPTGTVQFGKYCLRFPHDSLTMSDNIVPLVRRFAPVSKDADTADDEATRVLYGLSEALGWGDLLAAYRSVILAGAGAGKTFEMRSQAEALRAQGCQAFFIRLENVKDDLARACEIGTGQDLAAWLTRSDEAWFFLDAVDESRLEGPLHFERAIRTFASCILGGLNRAHIVISSRPYAWRNKRIRR